MFHRGLYNFIGGIPPVSGLLLDPLDNSVLYAAKNDAIWLGENTGEGTPGVCGIPTLNITCRLLKDPADAQTGDVTAPISFFGLYTAMHATKVDPIRIE